MERRSHNGLNYFENINWLPVNHRVDQCIAVPAYNFKYDLSSAYMPDIDTLNSSPVVRTRRFVDNFVESIYVKEISRKLLSYLKSKI